MGHGALQALGGIGLFLLGMHVMTDGLKQLAGGSLKAALRRWTRSPTSGAAVGAVSTAVIQSSSATTVTAIGFVGAGLITFAEALGIIFGANIGTTITGWLVALFGFKVPLGTVALALAFAGAMITTFTRGWLAGAGTAIAGFALVFIGIDFLQAGLGSLQDTISPDSFPANTMWGRVQLVGIGIVVTLVTQSSSAGVAMAITAVNAGTISFPQAAAVVIGMDVGTTSTAAFATIGGSTQVRRTGLAHVIYNLLTAVFAYFLLIPYVGMVERLGSDTTDDPELLLVGFHTLFNGLGVLAVLPFARQFAALVERIVPVPDDDLAHRLEPRLLNDPELALSVAEQTLKEIAAAGAALFLDQVDHPRQSHSGEYSALLDALASTRTYLARVDSRSQGDNAIAHHTALMHAADHIERLIDRLDRANMIAVVATDETLTDATRVVRGLVGRFATWLGGGAELAPDDVEVVARGLDAHRRLYRNRQISEAITNQTSAERVDERLDAMRWLVRVAAHVWRVNIYLSPPWTAPVAHSPLAQRLETGD